MSDAYSKASFLFNIPALFPRVHVGLRDVCVYRLLCDVFFGHVTWGISAAEGFSPEALVQALVCCLRLALPTRNGWNKTNTNKIKKSKN